VSREAQHDLAIMRCIQEKAVASPCAHNHMVATLLIASHGQTCWPLSAVPANKYIPASNALTILNLETTGRQHLDKCY